MAIGDQATIPATDTSELPLPLRDFILLPLVSLATVVLLLVMAEAGSRTFWPRQEEDSCAVQSALGYRFRPNCTSRVKAAEGPWTTDTYNECGYRTKDPCGPKPAGTVRIVLLGASVTHGLEVPEDETFAARLGVSLAHDLKRPVQIENLGVPGPPGPVDIYRRLPEVIALQPDAVVYSISPIDLNPIDPVELAHRNDPRPVPQDSKDSGLSLLASLHKTIIHDSSAVLVAQHFALQNPDTFIRATLYSREKSAYLREGFSPDWQARFDGLQVVIDDMSARLRARKIAFLVVALPTRVEAALLPPQRHRPDLDAFAYGDRIREITVASGATYVDLMRPFSELAKPEELFYVVNGHFSGEGQGYIARQLTPAVERVLAGVPAQEKE